MQFYLFVPLLFSALYFLSREARYILCSIIGVVSFTAQSLSPPLYEHGFTPLRFWQFIIGIMVFYWSTQVDDDGEYLLGCKEFLNLGKYFPDLRN
jgi:peptidoglycan/LPS O-acetylase OafA/YrhL